MQKKQFAISNKVEELNTISLALEELSEKWQLSPKIIMNMNLVLEEIITNIIFYGYDDDAEHQIKLELYMEDNALVVVIRDDANEFDILATDSFSDQDKPAEERSIGGLGIHFVKSLVDRIDYRRKNETNTLTLYKNL